MPRKSATPENNKRLVRSQKAWSPGKERDFGASLCALSVGNSSEVPVDFIGSVGTACVNADLPSRKKIRAKQDVERQRMDISSILAMSNSVDCHAVVISTSAEQLNTVHGVFHLKSRKRRAIKPAASTLLPLRLPLQRGGKGSRLEPLDSITVVDRRLHSLTSERRYDTLRGDVWRDI